MTEYRGWRRNFAAMVLDAVVWNAGFSFCEVTVILPVFIERATASTLLVGLMQTIRIIGFFTPQLLSAGIGGKRYKKKTLIKWTLTSRCSLVLAALAALLTDDLPLITMAFFLSFMAFHTLDGFSVVPWLELSAKSIPPRRRGSFFGLIMFGGGLSSIVVGVVVSMILNHPDLPFPRNYGILVLIELITLICGVTFLFLVKEKPDEVVAEERGLLKSLGSVPAIIRGDHNFGRLMVIQLLTSCYGMVLPFYAIYALSRLGSKEGFSGLFLSFQMLGRLLAGFLWGRLGDMGHNRRIIQCTISMFLVSPILAAATGAFQFSRTGLEYTSLLIFALLGASMGGVWVGFNSYIMEKADGKDRPLLLGFFNSLNIVTSVLPLVGGVLVESLSYEVAFLTAAVPLTLALLISRGLK